MLIRVGDDRTGRIDLALAGIMSCAAGAINAVGFLIAGTFSANMTGNVSAMADELAAGRIWTALAFSGLLLAFISGAAAAAIGIQTGERRGIRSVYSIAILVEAMILLLAGIFQNGGFFQNGGGLQNSGGDMARQEGLIIALCFVMGLQNAVTTMISRARVRTTHVSGMATDVGIELAAMFGDQRARAEAAPKLRLHALTLVCFALGGIGGALLYAFAGRWLFTIVGVVLLIVALPELWRAHRIPS